MGAAEGVAEGDMGYSDGVSSAGGSDGVSEGVLAGVDADGMAVAEGRKGGRLLMPNFSRQALGPRSYKERVSSNLVMGMILLEY